MNEETHKLDSYREGIDEVDAEIVRLLDRRARLARGIGEIKKAHGLDAYVPSRERKVLDRVKDLGEGDFPKGGLESVFREIISSSISLEEKMKVAYLGPETTFTHEAAMRAFGTAIELVPQATVAEVFARVERGEAHQGVVPVENSMEGAVTHTLDELTTSPLKICGEVYLPVSQNLLSAEHSIEDVRLVCSHPMALAQSTNWLRRELPQAELQEVASTGEAARRAAGEPGVAAIGSILAADAYGLSVLARNIQESRTNTTRFIVLGRKWAGRTGRDKTSIVLDPALKDRPGMLRDTLSILADEGINMIRIESRPNRKRAWTYIFFIDLQGHPEDENVRRALETLEEKCHYVAVIGAYPETSPVALD
ncbi:Prephenate dehydratase [Rubrobacter radiotolerans]|uniref:Bifunctional chorismate mutase/prephenate dehydratase n=1 Tax=Rubrobacter radiotolerans TaxID=42256 RepID=A0A023X2S2_RUBRA|nr:prephenate dehydratase [Rubrobacter radiotolerans]AHY46506.1 Prephenate dehydratase [Rubrobacter radiotolerans]MDX5893913.1 prephenate dehydratase [Rubrobacter radiotolerans]SMC04755.1 chorismate mutase / prephenate dehydratase [Rubrobacter radiotolerans DSM 5868]